MYIASLYLRAPVATEVCYEFDIAGNFRADVLLGSRAAGEFCVVEFEPGDEAVFKRQPQRKNPEWGARFEHAFSQIVDWFWALDDLRQTDDFRTTFGDGQVVFTSLLVMGRDADIVGTMRRRMEWRAKKVLIDSNTVNCVTFDGLYSALRAKYEFYAAAAEAERTTPAPGLPPFPGA